MDKLSIKVYSTCCNDICGTFMERLEELSDIYGVELEEINLYSKEGIEASTRYNIKHSMFILVSNDGNEIFKFDGVNSTKQLIDKIMSMIEEDPIEETTSKDDKEIVVDETKKTDGDKHRRFGNEGTGMPFVDKQLEQSKKVEEPKLEK